MIIAPNEFIPKLDFKPLLELKSEEDIPCRTELSFNDSWTLDKDLAIAHLIITGSYYRINKQNSKKLIYYVAEKDHLVNIENFDNEYLEISKSVSTFCKEFIDYFNKELWKTKAKIKINQVSQTNIDFFCQKIISNLHEKLQRPLQE